MGNVEQIITDLLRIAKVAMPGKLYAEDPRVIRAQTWLNQASAIRDIEKIVTPPVSRPPDTGRR